MLWQFSNRCCAPFPTPAHHIPGAEGAARDAEEHAAAGGLVRQRPRDGRVLRLVLDLRRGREHRADGTATLPPGTPHVCRLCTAAAGRRGCRHFSALPNVVQQAVLGRFEADIVCGGAARGAPPPTPASHGSYEHTITSSLAPLGRVGFFQSD